MPEHGIDFRSNEVYECGAALIALLALPEEKFSDRRAELHGALCALALHAMAQSDDTWRWTPQKVKPGYLLISPSEVARADRQCRRQLHHRMVAARMAMPLLREASEGKVPTLPKGMNRLSINELAGLVAEDVGQEDTHNIEARVWRPSLPVVHIAAAVAVTINEAERASGHVPNFGDFMLNKEWISRVVVASQEFDALFNRSTRVRRNAATVVQLRLANN